MDQNENCFKEMGLKKEILKALEELGFEKPTPIQAKAIPTILEGSHDLLGFAQTGTGKTAAFSLPIIQQVDQQFGMVQALILCPTRELCMQITKDIEKFTKYMGSLDVVAIYGGSSMRDQIRGVEKGAQIVVGTPGRVKDLIMRKKLQLQGVKWLVLDEADDMLDKGFKEDLDDILDTTPKGKQTLLFSATMSPWIRKVADQRMNQPEEIRVAAQNQGADTVEHQYVTVHEKDRYAALRRLLDINPDVYGIVFCRTRRETKEVADKLIEDNYLAQAIHGDISQSERSDTMKKFREGKVQILVATDVAARGIDVDELTHVINYQLPDSPETYVHRSGRTGRAGNTGISLTIINLKEKGKLKRIEQIMKKQFTAIKIPTGKAICEAQLMSLVHRVKESSGQSKNLEPYLPAIYEELKDLDRDQLIQHFVAVEFDQLLRHYANIKDIFTQQGQPERGGRDNSKGRGKRNSNMKMRTYKINIGKKSGFSPKNLFSLINQNKKLRGIEIGGIQIEANQTKFEADASFHKELLGSLSKKVYRKQQVKIFPA